jgi:hypothetical protein
MRRSGYFSPRSANPVLARYLFVGPVSPFSFRRAVGATAESVRERTKPPLKRVEDAALTWRLHFPNDLPAPSRGRGCRDPAPAARSPSDPFNRPARWSPTRIWPGSYVPCDWAKAFRKSTPMSEFLPQRVLIDFCRKRGAVIGEALLMP